MTTTNRHITQAHLDEWVDDSAVKEAIARLNFESLDDPIEIAKRLNWKSYRGPSGWWGGNSAFGQWKPDIPIQFPDDEKPRKYLTPKDTPIQPILPLVDDETWDEIASKYGKAISEEVRQRGFWAWVRDNPDIPIHLVEGLKKACSLLTANNVAIAIVGVDCAQRRKQLLPELEPYATQGRQIYITFDADIVVKPEVERALKTLGKLLKARGCTVFVLEWELTLGKGCDDVLAQHGRDKWDEIASNPTAFDEWLKKIEGQFQEQSGTRFKKDKSPKPPEPIIIALELADKYRQQLAWNDEAHFWFRYEGDGTPGVWTRESDICIEAVVGAELNADPRTAGKYSYNYLANIIKLMRSQLLVRRWDNTYSLGIVPMLDGVLHLETMELREHAPGYRLLWALPYAWKDRGIGCQPIIDWLMDSMRGDRDIVELLRAYLNAVVTGRTDLQRFLECVGPGGTGKSTYTRLAQALVGVRNTFVTELKHLEQNRFETSGIYGKRLVIVTDSERYGGTVTVLKALTGQDSVRYERKHIQQDNNGFVPTALVIIAANEAPQSADYTSGLVRRKIPTLWLNEVAPEYQRNLIEFLGDTPSGEFTQYLPGLLAWVLELSRERVAELVKNTDKSVPSLKQVKRNALCEINPLADWMDNCVIHRPGDKTYVGIAKRDKDSESPNMYQCLDFWLYANYCEYAAATGHRAVSQTRFTSLLEDLCRSQLKLEGVFRGKDRRGSFFEGLAIRRDGDSDRRPVTDAEPPSGMPPNSPNSDRTPLDSGGSTPPSRDGSRDGCDGSVTAETLTSDGCDGCDGLFQLFPIEDYWAENSESELGNKGGEDKGEPSPPITNPEAQLQQGSQPSQHPSPTHHNPSSQTEAIAFNQSQQPEAAAQTEAAALSDAIAPNKMAAPPEPLKVGDLVMVGSLGLKHHGKQGTIVRLKTECFQGQELQLADLSFPGERRYVEVQLSWLCRVEVRRE